MKSNLDSRSLQLFCAVSEARSFRGAAELLHMSQPPLSRAIRELEERLGRRLFHRERPVRLTDAGQNLLPKARRILNLLAQAERDLMSAAPKSIVRLGLTDAVEPKWYERLMQSWPTKTLGRELRTTSASSPKLVRQLRAKQLDAAIIALPVDSVGLHVDELERQALCVALRGSHPLASRRRVSLSDLAKYPAYWFERSRQPAFFDHCQRVFRRCGFEPKLREPAEHHVLLAHVAAGRGAALLPSSLRSLRRTGVVYRQLCEGEELSVAVGLATAPGQDPLRALLLETIAG